MNFQRYENVDAFAKIVTPFLEKNEDKFSLFLGVLKGIKASAYENPYMATIEENGQLLAIFQMTPPHPLNIIFVDENQISTCIDLCISELTKHAVPVESIISVKEWAVLFAQKWQEKTDGNYSLMMDQGLYRLDQVEESLEMSPGKWRYATISDAQLIEKWYSQFEQDTGLSVTAPEEIKKRVKNMLDGKEVFFWEDQGEVVSMMKKSRPTTNGITVSLVFTPAEKRKKGYGRTLVATVSRELLKEFEFCVLYTDMLNPTSNKIYQEIGYKKLVDSVHLKLETK
ncbi:GNAT family N-acetyltransferase [Psychrobacillus psychrodurans]|uniref:GNAT family N-acetyltransferase n=1 Tax=Psychrobacillus psychrodurans TaxID=126157 RepID=A0A9X3LAM5_9BACI|nr:GNAT family N-acetyltransferase [Psychrobacillus psychrodurans]MCZ8534487.1 GNAT family N-acetyltransferase [Psychrobacillus psychrodurans]